jgi:hypothetical protein
MFAPLGVHVSFQMDIQCLAWNIKDDIMGSFPGGPKYYLPYRCHETRLAGQEICAKCSRKKELPRSNKNHPARWWGLVTEPISDIGDQISHFAFSPWFLEWAKKRPLSPESMVRAKKSIQRAQEGIPNPPALPEVPVNTIVQPKVEEPKVEEAKVAEAPVVKKKPRVVKPKENQETPVAEKKKKPRVVKAKQEPVVNVTPQAILSEETPLEAEDVIEVSVRPFEHAGNLYYMDGKKSKLYDRQKDGGCKGIYMGRWDSVSEKIVKDEDSDRELD